MIACNESALIVEETVLPGDNPFSVKVRRIDDAALKLLRRHRPPGCPVGLWYPESLDGLERVDASHVVLTSAAALDAGDLARLSPSVRTLSIYGPAFAAGSVDPASMPHLEQLTLAWAMMDPRGHLPEGLRSLTFRGEGAQSTLTAIPLSAHLEWLDVSPGRRITTLDGLDRFPRLRHLELDGARLADLSALAHVPDLEWLTLVACRGLPDLGPIARLPRLHHLRLVDCGDIPSLRPFAGNPTVADVVANGTTRVADGDLSPLLAMPALTQVIIASRRAYKPSIGAVRVALGLPEKW